MIAIQEIIKERILILDGAMGTMIQNYGLHEDDFRGNFFHGIKCPLKGNNDLLCITRPNIVTDIHRKYLEAGADLIETNTFNANAISQSDYQMAEYVYKINLEAAHIARHIADKYTRHTPSKPRFVVGSVGPTNKTCSMSPDVNNPSFRSLKYDDLMKAYLEQITALLQGGVDAILIETIFDTLNAKAAIYAASQAMEDVQRFVPLMLSVTIADKGGRTLSGQTIGAFLASVEHAPIFSVGLNCSFGAKDLKPFLKELAAIAPYYISVYPNAGLPNQLGEYEQTPEQMAVEMSDFISEGLVNIIGGCCGTTDAFISHYPSLVEGRLPHKPVAHPDCLWLSGLNLLEIKQQNNFINIGERCNVAGSRKFLRLIKEKKYEEALSIARKQVEDGAQVLDINMDDGLLDTRDEMVNFLNLIASEPEISAVPIMIDSSKWDVIVSGLKCLQGKCIVNSISLKEGEEIFLDHARIIQQLGAAVVVMAFDEKGQAETYERKIEVCQRAYNLLVNKLHFNPQNIIFDPNILSIATGIEEHNSHAIDFIRAVEWIHANLKGAHISGGVSNLSFSFRGNNYIREAMHAVFLYYAIAKGMDMGIVNPTTSVLYCDIPADLLQSVTDAILNRFDEASERLVEKAIQYKEKEIQIESGSEKLYNEWRNKPVDERLQYALIKGVSDYLETDLKDAFNKYSHAVDIIEGPLMSGMNSVGTLFGSGKMFLPQVVKTARTMKSAVSILQPFIESEKNFSNRASKKILLATVKGDVHDIGKNIVSVVLACNGYDVIDLGIMVPSEDIINSAISESVDMIGLSGLITPSLDEMIHVASEMQHAGLNIPLVIGGATTSELHTALKIATVYTDGPVVYARDASQIALIAAQLFNSVDSVNYKEQLIERYKILREEYKENTPKVVSLDQARENRLKLY